MGPITVASQGGLDLPSTSMAAMHLVIFSLRSPRSGEEGGEAVEAWDRVEGTAWLARHPASLLSKGKPPPKWNHPQSLLVGGFNPFEEN